MGGFFYGTGKVKRAGGKKGKDMKRVIAFLLCNIFLVTTISSSAPAMYDGGGAPLYRNGAVKPKTFEVNIPDRDNVRTLPSVAVIRDAHCNYEAQLKEAEIIKDLIENKGYEGIYVEGAVGRVDTAIFTAYPYRDIKEKVFKEALRKGDINAADYYAVMREGKLTWMHGVEDGELYRENYDAALNLIKNRDVYEAFIKEKKEEIALLKKKYYSAELLELDLLIEDYNTGTFSGKYRGGMLGLMNLLKHLFGYISKYNLDLSAYPEFKRLKAISAEDKDAGIDAGELLSEVDKFSSYLKSLVFRNKKEREIDDMWLFLLLLENGISLELTSVEWDKLKKLKYLLKSEGFGGLEECFRSVALFYSYVEKRNEVIYSNLMRYMMENGHKKVILLAGGFHSGYLRNKLSEAGVSSVVIEPDLKKAKGRDTLYLDKLLSLSPSVSTMALVSAMAEPARMKKIYLTLADEYNARFGEKREDLIIEILRRIKKILGNDRLQEYVKFIEKNSDFIYSQMGIDKNNLSLLDVIEPYGEYEKVLGAIDRRLVHKLGLLHRTANAFVMLSNGDIVVQHRSEFVPSEKMKISIFGGHVDSGMTYKQTISKELREELFGNRIEKLKGRFRLIGKEGNYTWNNGWNNEIRSLYVYFPSKDEEIFIKERIDKINKIKAESNYDEYLSQIARQEMGLREIFGLYIMRPEDVFLRNKINICENFKDRTINADYEYTSDLLAPIVKDDEIKKNVMGMAFSKRRFFSEKRFLANVIGNITKVKNRNENETQLLSLLDAVVKMASSNNNIVKLCQSIGIDLLAPFQKAITYPEGYPDYVSKSVDILEPFFDKDTENILFIERKNRTINSDIDFIIIGGGKMGSIVASRINALVDKGIKINLKAIVDPFKSKKEVYMEYSKRNNGKKPLIVHSLDELNLDTSKTVIAYIAVPDEYHLQVLKDAYSHGISKVILEKPLAHSYKEVLKIKEYIENNNIAVVVNEQYYYSAAIAAIKKYIKENNLTPRLLINVWAKDRRHDSENNRNTEANSVFYYDMFHQIAIADAILGEGKVVKSFAEDMILYNQIIPKHRDGILISDHSGVKSVSVITHISKGRKKDADRILNLYAVDENDKVHNIRVNFGSSIYMYSHITDDVGRINKIIFDSPIDHSIPYSVLALLDKCDVPATIGKILDIHKLVDDADKSVVKLQYNDVVQVANVNENGKKLAYLKDSFLKNYNGYKLDFGKSKGKVSFYSKNYVTYIWILSGKSVVMNNNEVLIPGDQISISPSNKLILKGNFSYAKIMIDKNIVDYIKEVNIVHWRNLTDVSGGCNISKKPFRRFLIPVEKGKNMGLNVHLVEIDKDSSYPHVHYDNQGELYFVLNPKDFNIVKNKSGSLDFFLSENSEYGDEYSHYRVNVGDGSVIYIPSGVSHQADNMVAVVVAIPGFDVNNEIKFKTRFDDFDIRPFTREEKEAAMDVDSMIMDINVYKYEEYMKPILRSDKEKVKSGSIKKLADDGTLFDIFPFLKKLKEIEIPGHPMSWEFFDAFDSILSMQEKHYNDMRINTYVKAGGNPSNLPYISFSNENLKNIITDLFSRIDDERKEVLYLLPFLVDVGRCVMGQAHPEIGARFFVEPILKKLGFSNEAIEFARLMVETHTDIGTVLTTERHPSAIKDRKMGDVEFKALTLLSIADRSYGDRGDLLNQKLFDDMLEFNKKIKENDYGKDWYLKRIGYYLGIKTGEVKKLLDNYIADNKFKKEDIENIAYFFDSKVKFIDYGDIVFNSIVSQKNGDMLVVKFFLLLSKILMEVGDVDRVNLIKDKRKIDILIHVLKAIDINTNGSNLLHELEKCGFYVSKNKHVLNVEIDMKSFKNQIIDLWEKKRNIKVEKEYTSLVNEVGLEKADNSHNINFEKEDGIIWFPDMIKYKGFRKDGKSYEIKQYIAPNGSEDKFLVQYNVSRGITNKKVDGCGFCNAVNSDDNYMELLDLEKTFGLKFKLLADARPFFNHHMLIVEKGHTGKLTEEGLKELIWIFNNLFPGMRGNVGTGNAANHLHTHVYEVEFPIERAEKNWFAELDNIKFGTLVTDANTAGFVIKSNDTEELASCAFKLIKMIENAGWLVTVITAPNHIYIMPQKSKEIGDNYPDILNAFKRNRPKGLRPRYVGPVEAAGIWLCYSRGNVPAMETMYKTMNYEILKQIMSDTGMDINSELFKSILNAFKGALKLKYGIIDNNIPYIELHLTNKCNLKCKWCSYANSELARDAHLKYEDVVKITSFNPEEILIVGGGEPTLYQDGNKNFNDVVLRFRELMPDVKLRLITNGTYIPKGEWINKINEISISLDAASRDSYKNGKGRDLFDVVWKNIFDYLKVVENEDSMLENVRVTIVYGNTNIEEAWKLSHMLWNELQKLQRAKIISAKTASKLFFLMLPKADDFNPENPYIIHSITQEQKVKWKKLIDKSKKDRSFYNFILNNSNVCKILDNNLEAIPAERCSSVTNYLLIGADKKIRPCYSTYIAKQGVVLGTLDSSDRELIMARQKLFHNSLSNFCQKGCRPGVTFYGLKAYERYMAEVKQAKEAIANVKKKDEIENKTGFVDIKEAACSDEKLVGGKAMNLHYLFEASKVSNEFIVPNGIIIPTNYFDEIVLANRKVKDLINEIKHLKVSDDIKIRKLSEKVRKEILNIKLPEKFVKKLLTSFQALNKNIAVRSSATVEDADTASCAGQADSYLNITNSKDLIEAIKNVWASLYNHNFISYRLSNGIEENNVKMSIILQEMAPAVVSGVVMTRDETSKRPGFSIVAKRGFGENVVQGKGYADSWFVSLDAEDILEVAINETDTPSLKDNEVINVANVVLFLKKYYHNNLNINEIDVEFAIGSDNKVYILQARPITTGNVTEKHKIKTVDDKFSKSAEKIIFPKAIIGNIGAVTGRLQIIDDPNKYDEVESGSIVVVPSTRNSWDTAFQVIKGIITEQGNNNEHAAITSRERNIPALIAVPNAIEKLKKYNGKIVTIDSRLKALFIGNIPLKEITVENGLWKTKLEEKKSYFDGTEWSRFYGHPITSIDFEGMWLYRPNISYSFLQLSYYKKAFEEKFNISNKFNWQEKHFVDGVPAKVEPRKIKYVDYKILLQLLREKKRPFTRFLDNLTLEGYEYLCSLRNKDVIRLINFVNEKDNLTDVEIIKDAVKNLSDILFWPTIIFSMQYSFNERFFDIQMRNISDYKWSNGYSYVDLMKEFSILSNSEYRYFWENSPSSRKDIEGYLILEKMCKNNKYLSLLDNAEYKTMIEIIKSEDNNLWNMIKEYSLQYKFDTEDIRVSDETVEALEYIAHLNRNKISISKIYHLMSVYFYDAFVHRINDAELKNIINESIEFKTLINFYCKYYKRSYDDAVTNLIDMYHELRIKYDTVVNTLQLYPNLKRIITVGTINEIMRKDMHHYVSRYQKVVSNSLKSFDRKEGISARTRTNNAIFNLSLMEIAQLLRSKNIEFVKYVKARNDMSIEAETSLRKNWQKDREYAFSKYKKMMEGVIDYYSKQIKLVDDKSLIKYYKEQIIAIEKRLRYVKRKIHPIVHVSYQDPEDLAGGQGWAVLNLCKAQISRGYDVTWISPCIKDEEPGIYYYENGMLKVIKIKISDSKVLTLYGNDKLSQKHREAFGKIFPAKIKEMFDSRYAYVHLHGFIEVPRHVKELKDMGYKVISTFHMTLTPRIEATGQIKNIGRKFFKYLRSVESESINANDIIIVNSNEMATELRRISPSYSGKIMVIPNGIGKEHFIEKSYSSEGMVVSYGRISREKRFDLFIKAAKLITDRRLKNGKETIRFLLFGKSDTSIPERVKYVNELRELAKGYDNIIIDIRPDGINGRERLEYLDKSDIGVVLSSYEPFGLVIPELLSRGKPVVSTLTSGAKDILLNDEGGICSNIVNINPSVEEVADAIEELLYKARNNPETRKIAIKVALKYNWDNIMPRIINLFESSEAKDVQYIASYLAQREVYDIAKGEWTPISEEELISDDIDLVLICGSNDYVRTPKAAAELYKKITANKVSKRIPIIISGKWGEHCGTVGQQKTEAEIFMDEMVRCGVDKNVFILEKEATNMGENISFSKPLILKALAGKENVNILVLHNPSGQRRAALTFVEQIKWNNGNKSDKQPYSAISDGKNKISIGKVFSYSPYEYELNTLLEGDNDKHDNASVDFMMGEVERIIKYRKKEYGFIGETRVPNSVRNAYSAYKMKNSEMNIIPEIVRILSTVKRGWPVPNVVAGIIDNDGEIVTALNGIGKDEHAEINLIFKILKKYVGEDNPFAGELELLEKKIRPEKLSDADIAKLSEIAKSAGNPFDGKTVYVSMEPCKNCLRKLGALGIKNIRYIYENPAYENSSLAKELGIKMEKAAIADDSLNTEYEAFFKLRKNEGYETLRDTIRAFYNELCGEKSAFDRFSGYLDKILGNIGYDSDLGKIAEGIREKFAPVVFNKFVGEGLLKPSLAREEKRSVVVYEKEFDEGVLSVLNMLAVGGDDVILYVDDDTFSPPDNAKIGNIRIEPAYSYEKYGIRLNFEDVLFSVEEKANDIRVVARDRVLKGLAKKFPYPDKRPFVFLPYDESGKYSRRIELAILPFCFADKSQISNAPLKKSYSNEGVLCYKFDFDRFSLIGDVISALLERIREFTNNSHLISIIKEAA